MRTKKDTTTSYTRAQKRVKKIKAFYIHLSVYFLINIIFLLKNTINEGWEGFAYSFMGFGLFWGIGLFFHWYNTFGSNLFFSKKWENRKIKELLDKDKKEMWE